MKRKVIKQGHNTLTVTLPSEWVKRFNLGAGSEIDLSERENGLFLSTEKNKTEKKTEFDITGMDIPTIWKYFMAAYREGYDEVIVRFQPGTELENPYKFFTQNKVDKYNKQREKKRITEVLQSFVDRFIGFEIIEIEKDFIKIKEMTELTSKEFDSSLRRIFLIIQQMAEETLDALKTHDYKQLLHMHDVDIHLDKFHDYCIRILNKVGSKEPRKTSLLFSTLYLLELLGDEFKNISLHLVEDYSAVKLVYILPLAQAVKEQFDHYYELFYKFDKEKVAKLSEADKKIYFIPPDVFKKTSGEEREIFYHLRIIVRYLNALTELRIEMEF